MSDDREGGATRRWPEPAEVFTPEVVAAACSGFFAGSVMSQPLALTADMETTWLGLIGPLALLGCALAVTAAPARLYFAVATAGLLAGLLLAPGDGLLPGWENVPARPWVVTFLLACVALAARVAARIPRRRAPEEGDLTGAATAAALGGFGFGLPVATAAPLWIWATLTVASAGLEDESLALVDEAAGLGVLVSFVLTVLGLEILLGHLDRRFGPARWGLVPGTAAAAGYTVALVLQTALVGRPDTRPGIPSGIHLLPPLVAPFYNLVRNVVVGTYRAALRRLTSAAPPDRAGTEELDAGRFALDGLAAAAAGAGTAGATLLAVVFWAAPEMGTRGGAGAAGMLDLHLGVAAVAGLAAVLFALALGASRRPADRVITAGVFAFSACAVSLALGQLAWGAPPAFIPPAMTVPFVGLLAVFALVCKLPPAYGDRLGGPRAGLAAAGLLVAVTVVAAALYRPPAERAFPPRAGDTPPRLVDLTAAYNAPLADLVDYSAGLGYASPGELKTGRQEIDGVAFDLRGLVLFGGDEAASPWRRTHPRRVTGVRVDQYCGRLHFLHAEAGPETREAPGPKTEVGYYEIVYEDTTFARVPLRPGVELGNRFPAAAAGAPPPPRPAWVSGRGSGGAERQLALFRTAWENPRPEAKIVAVDCVGRTGDHPLMLLGLTAEEPSRDLGLPGWDGASPVEATGADAGGAVVRGEPWRLGADGSWTGPGGGSVRYAAAAPAAHPFELRVGLGGAGDPPGITDLVLGGDSVLRIGTGFSRQGMELAGALGGRTWRLPPRSVLDDGSGGQAFALYRRGSNLALVTPGGWVAGVPLERETLSGLGLRATEGPTTVRTFTLRPHQRAPVEAYRHTALQALPPVEKRAAAIALGVVDRTWRAVPAGSIWSYHEGHRGMASGWEKPAFDEGAWKRGRALLGYGDNDEETPLQPGSATYYFRTRFHLDDPAAHRYLSLSATVDDAAVFYLNGTEVARFNLRAGPVGPRDLAVTARSGRAEREPFTALVAVPGLFQSENVLAVEVHQVRLDSSDLAFDLELVAGGSAFDILYLGGDEAINTYPAPEAALADLVRATEEAPDHPQRWFVRGALEARLGRTEDALASFTRAGRLLTEAGVPNAENPYLQPAAAERWRIDRRRR